VVVSPAGVGGVWEGTVLLKKRRAGWGREKTERKGGVRRERSKKKKELIDLNLSITSQALLLFKGNFVAYGDPSNEGGIWGLEKEGTRGSTREKRKSFG